MHLKPTTRSLLLFVALCGLLLFNSWHFFSLLYHEQGDIALNALQIHRAKSLEEIYGNYSRFHFNHPGPAFFYVYAGAEVLFSDTLHWLSPHTAHSLAGVFLQVGFFTLALHILSGHVQRRLFLPLALALGACHFAKAGDAFISIWPPHVLLMPFFAFFTACVSVACGRGRHLLWAVIAGCFLVHGHVAQPLFVGGLFLVSYLLLCRSARTSEPKTNPLITYRWAHLGAIALIALFLVPMAIDFAKGEESNFQAILRHLKYAGDHKKFIKSLLYFLSFFSYVANQHEILQKLSWQSAAFLREGLGWYLAWISGLGVLITAAWRGRLVQGEKLRVLRTALFFWAATAGLCLYWGRMQTGAMFQYNGYFYYALIYFLLLLVAWVVVERVPDALSRWLSPVLVIAAVLIGYQGVHYPGITPSESGINLRDQVLAALKADPQKTAPKVLVFTHDHWPAVATAALALERANVEFYVDPSWTFMFQKRHELSSEWFLDPKNQASVWHFMTDPSAPGTPYGDKLKIVTALPSLSPSDGTIDFAEGGNFEHYQVVGFSTPMPGDFAPTAQKDAILQFIALPTTQAVELRMIAEPFLAPGNQKIQPTELRFNGHLVFSAPFTEPGVLRARISPEIWNQNKVATIHLTLPNAHSPAEMGLSGDVRRLGLSIKRITTELGTQ